jgi:hypothetical protein
MLTTEHPIPLAEVMTMLLFSVIWNALSGLGFPPFAPPGLFNTRSSIVSGTESLMSLQRTRPSTPLAAVIGVVLTSTLVEQLHRIGRDGEEVTNILVSRKNLI